MNPQELSEEVEKFIRLCCERVGPDSIGARQYHVEGQPQKFETMPLDALAEYYEEELRDIANYAAMTHIRLGRLREAIKIPMSKTATEQAVDVISDRFEFDAREWLDRMHSRLGATASYLERFPEKIGDGKPSPVLRQCVGEMLWVALELAALIGVNPEEKIGEMVRKEYRRGWYVNKQGTTVRYDPRDTGKIPLQSLVNIS